MAGFAERRAEIVRQLVAAADAAELVVLDDPALLDEVTALVERPNVLACEFAPEFLEVPAECLVLTMKANQKYFPLLDPSGALTHRFLVVSNIAPADPSRVIEGNERVIRPRLADAKFFFDQDRRITLATRVAALDRVVYHGRLGSQGERVRRVQAIARALAVAIGAGAELADQADRAALLAKADLLTGMVGEFPELQGTMGRYYALNDGEDSEVAVAIEDHYKPRFAGDELPRNPAGALVALADKIETVVGLFGIGQQPTGDKDPFALRRHALGIVRLLIERDMNIGLLPLIDLAISAMPSQVGGDWRPPFEFIKERAKAYFEDKGFDRRAVDSVLEPHGALLPLGQLPEIVQEASTFIATSEGQLLAEANKRITNILKKSGFEVPFGLSPHALKEGPDVGIFRQDEERALFSTLRSAGENALQLRNDKKFAASLAALIPLSVPTKAFFDKVMVNVDDVAVRDNRIRLLQVARAYMNLVADLTLMAR
ncbi:MAG: glycine--tRNA ligase subunit beta [Caldimonas sp.]